MIFVSGMPTFKKLASLKAYTGKTTTMDNIPKPTLGNINAITIATPDPENSLVFYQKLGFKEVLRGDFPFIWIQVSDGQLLIMLRKAEERVISLTYYVKDVEEKAAALEAEGIAFVIKPDPGDFIKRYVMRSPDGFNVTLVTLVENYMTAYNPVMLSMPPADMMNPENYPNKICGLFGEYAQPVKDIDTSFAFWEKLGFKILTKMSSPYPWAIISDGLSVVGLHQTSDFTDPTITFFAADMKDKIEQLQNNGITAYKEKGSGSVVLKTPEGQFINLFKMGM